MKKTKIIIHTFSAFWLRSSVVSVLISVKTGKIPTGILFSHQFLYGGMGLLCSHTSIPKLHLCCTYAFAAYPKYIFG